MGSNAHATSRRAARTGALTSTRLAREKYINPQSRRPRRVGEAGPAVAGHRRGRRQAACDRGLRVVGRHGSRGHDLGLEQDGSEHCHESACHPGRWRSGGRDRDPGADDRQHRCRRLGRARPRIFQRDGVGSARDGRLDLLSASAEPDPGISRLRRDRRTRRDGQVALAGLAASRWVGFSHPTGRIELVVRPILSFEHPVLREKAKKVTRIDTSIQRLLDDLTETMLDAPGAGLAANQIGVALRVCVVKGDDKQIWGLVNPEVVKKEGVQVGYEGCLSYPGWVGEVERAEIVVVKGRNRHGKEIRIKSNGFTARAFQHELGLPLYQPDRIRDPEPVERLRELAPDFLVVVAYGQILPRSVLDLPRLGALNVHASLLPRHRGAAPVARAILAGDHETGVTIMKMDEQLDHGPILGMRATPIGEREDAASLTARLAEMGAELLVETLEHFDELRVVGQDHKRATVAAKLRKEEGELEWGVGAQEIDRRVRGLQPWPGATLPTKRGPGKVRG